MTSEPRRSSRRELPRIRLALAIPVLMVLLPLILGIVHYRFLEELLDTVPSDSPMYGNLAVTLLSVFTATLVVCALSLLFGLGVSWTISRPISRLIRTTHEIATGDLSRTVPTNSGDEFSDLGSSFNKMIASLNRIVNERNRYILECYTGGLLILDEQGRVEAANSAAEKILGESGPTLISSSITEVLARHEGTEAFREIIERAMQRGEYVSSREISIRLRGEKDYPFMITTSPLRDVGGRRPGVVVNFRDLSEIKSFYRQMARADRLAAVGTLAAGVAHEIRNPLGSIKGLAQLLSEDSAADGDTRRYVDVIIREVDRLDRVVNQLLTFAQTEQHETRLWNVNRLLREALEMAQWQAGGENTARVTVREKYGEVPALPLHAESVNRAFLNLFINAFEACAKGGEIVLGSRLEPGNGSLGTVVVTIENTGEPVAPENIEKIFEPFFSTKPSGTGLGLPIVYQIITSHGGTIDVDSRGGRTVFSLRFPVAEGTTVSSQTG